MNGFDGTIDLELRGACQGCKYFNLHQETFDSSDGPFSLVRCAYYDLCVYLYGRWHENDEGNSK